MSTDGRPDPHDLTYDSALEAARTAWAKLQRQHPLSWQTKGNEFWIICGCDDRRRSTNAIESHIRDAARQARGPLKSK